MTKDVDLRYTSGNNTAVARFTIAVSRRGAKDGQQRADFINIVAWGKTAEFVGKYFTKGLQVAIVGRLQTRDYTDNNGKKHYITEVVADETYFADSKKDAGQQSTHLEADDSGFYPMDENDDSPF